MFDAFQAAQELRAAGEPAVLATVVWRRAPSSGKVGSRAIVHADGGIEGWIGGACAEPSVVREARAVLVDGVSRLVHLGPAEELPDPPPDGAVCIPIACESEGALQIYLEPLLPPPHLVIIGRTVAVDALAAMAAALGWRATVVDDGGDARRRSHAAQVVTRLDLAEAGVTAQSMVVVATQGHLDEEALEAAIATEAAYIGLVASRTRAARVRDWLRDRGASEADLARVRAPAGLDLGATAHEEIAVSILAELVQLRAAGTLVRAAPIQAEQPEEQVDPVCGMTVSADSRHRVEHEGRTYVFCCPGCKAAFAADPAAYAGADA